jgi:hypothetical protein
MPLISKVSRGQTITAEKMNTIIDALNEVRVTSVVGGQFSRGLGGTTITVTPPRSKQGGVEATVCPFDPTATAVTSGYKVSFSAGTINGVLPTNMNTPITNVTTSSNNYFYLKCTTDGKVVTSSVLEKDTTLRVPEQPTADTAPTVFNIMVGYMTTAGITERTIACGNLQARIAPSVQEDADTYTAGQRNYTQFYNWVF